MAKLEFTLDEARKNSSSFLYIFASDKYLSYIDKKYATVIKGKRANQRKLLTLSAQAYMNSDATYGGSEYNQYVESIRKGFVETYGLEPENALVKLALGETVAGKNWAEGVYGTSGIGKVATFYGTNISVDPATGHIFKNGKDYTDESKTVYKEIKKQAVPYQLFAIIDEVTYMSQYNKTYKKYYAQSYSNANGSFKASNGAAQGSSDAATMFENVQLKTWDFLNFVKEILAFFGINVNFGGSSSSTTTETINAENTLPNQQADGYVQSAGIGDGVAAALLIAAAAGTLVMGGLKKKSSK